MILVEVLVSEKGVKVDRELSNVTFPLLLTYRELYEVPNRLIVNPMFTCPVELSSLAARTFVEKPDRFRRAAEKAGAAPKANTMLAVRSLILRVIT
jgi:hypothetical protein